MIAREIGIKSSYVLCKPSDMSTHMNICYLSVLLHILFKHFFMLLLFVSLYLLYYCNYYLVIPRLNVSFIETN